MFFSTLVTNCFEDSFICSVHVHSLFFSPHPLFSHTYTVNNKNTNIATQHTARKHETSIRFFLLNSYIMIPLFLSEILPKDIFWAMGKKTSLSVFFQVYYMYKFLISNVSFLWQDYFESLSALAFLKVMQCLLNDICTDITAVTSN